MKRLEKYKQKTFSIIHEFLTNYPNIKQKKQVGSESFYPRRTKYDSELDISKTIEENFNLMRIGNNQSWPSFFYYKGKKFIIKFLKIILNHKACLSNFVLIQNSFIF